MSRRGSRRSGTSCVAGAQVWEPSASGSWNRYSLWRPDALYSYPHRDLHRRDDPIGAPIVACRSRVSRTALARLPHDPHLSPVAAELRRRLRPGGCLPACARRRRRGRRRPRRPPIAREFVEPDGTGSVLAPESREEWQVEGGSADYEAARYRLPTLSPLVSAWSAGLLCFWIVESRAWARRSCIAVPRPALHLESGQAPPARRASRRVELRHLLLVLGGPPRTQTCGRATERACAGCRSSPAPETSNCAGCSSTGSATSGSSTSPAATSSPRTTSASSGAATLQIDDEPLRVVEVVNSTPEPDGTYRRYLLRVPPTTRTAREAVAWTFGFDDPQQYLLAAES